MKTIKAFITLTCILIICSSGKIDRGFEALKIYDYFKAKKLFEKSLKRKPVPAAFGLSIIYGRNDNPFYNLDSAFKYIGIADTSYLKLDAKGVEKLKKHSLDSISIQNWKDSIDFKEFRKAKRINTIAYYERFLSKHQNQKINPKVTFKRDSIAFAKARSANNPQSYLSFAAKYPNSDFFNEAKNRYDERLFSETVSQNSSKAYQTFINSNSLSPYIKQAQDSLYSLETKKKTIGSYESFIESFPENRNVDLAWRSIYKIFTADFKPQKIADFRLTYPEYPFLNELMVDFELASKDFFPQIRNGRWGFIDEEGIVRIDFKYDYLETFKDGVALAVKDGKIGYINKTGQTVIPFIYSEGESFQSGFAVVAKKEKYGIINKANDIVVPFKYVEIGDLNSDLILVANDTAYGYVNRQGSIEVPLKYKTAYDFKNGLAIVKDSNLYGVINLLGEEVIKCIYVWMEPFNEFGLTKARLTGPWGILESNGGLFLPFDFSAIGDFSDSLVLVAKDEKYGYVNRKGELAIDYSFDYNISSMVWGKFKNGTAKYMLKKKFGIINTKGEKLFPAIFEDVGDYSDTSLVAVKKRGKWGYSNQNLQLIIPYDYLSAKTFFGNSGIVETENGWFLIDKEANSINEVPYESIEPINDNTYLIKTESGLGIIDSDNHKILNPIFGSVKQYNMEYLQLKSADGFLYYNIKDRKQLR